MINLVSDRIKNIIKSQDHVPNQRSNKSRDNSIDSNRSVLKSAFTTPKNKSSAQKFEKSVAQEKPSDDIYEKVKQSVLKIVYPLLTDMNHKIDLLTQSQNIVNSLIKQMQENFKSVNHLYSESDEIAKEMGFRLNILEERCEFFSQIQQQIIRIRQGQIHIGKKLTNLSLGEQNSRSPRDTFYHPSSYSSSKNPSTGFASFQPNNKCKCQKLVEEILKSQSHLMMELKYIKHFQGMTQEAKEGKERKKNRLIQNEYRREY